MISRTKVRASGRGAAYALAAWVLLIVIGSLIPGRIVGSWSAVVDNLEAGATLAIHEPILGTVFERFVSFFPLGWLVWRASVATLPRPWAFSCVAVSVFALVVELAQSLVDTRHARLTDFLLAMAFGWLGAGVAAWLGAPPSPVRMRRLLLTGLLTGNAILMLIVALLKAHASWRSRFGHSYLGAAVVPTSAAVLLGLHLGHHPDYLLIGAAAMGPAIGVLCLRSWLWLRAELRNLGA